MNKNVKQNKLPYVKNAGVIITDEQMDEIEAIIEDGVVWNTWSKMLTPAEISAALRSHITLLYHAVGTDMKLTDRDFTQFLHGCLQMKSMCERGRPVLYLHEDNEYRRNKRRKRKKVKR
jgi:hypothetical protein